MAHRTSERQLKSNRRWNRKHRYQERVYSYRSSSKNFIKNYATNDDLDKLQQLIDTRRQSLQNV